MTITATDCAPTVWVGCLAHYGAGELVGDWFPATEADTIDLAAVHKRAGRRWAACEELWVMDHENIPVRGEFGLLEAAEWGECFAEVGPEQWPALCAWVESGAHVTEGHGPIPSIPDFEERYCGLWDSFREYAEQQADDIGLTSGWPEEAQRYFDWNAWIRDFAFDYTVADAPDGGIYVFRNL